MDLATQEEAADLAWVYAVMPEQQPVSNAARILVGEDDPDMRRLVAAMLRTEGYRVVEAADGAEMLAHIEATMSAPPRDRFRAVVADIEMPGLTGLDVLAALRCANWRTPTIFITAFGNPDVRAEAEWLGAVTLLEKPFQPDALRGAIRKALALPSGPCTTAA